MLTIADIAALGLAKPQRGAACTSCGFCCAVEPCQLAQEFLRSTTGPCVALEIVDGHSSCGLVRNPLAYLFKAVHPAADVPLMGDPPLQGNELSVRFAAALGLGMGCDADDDAQSALWPEIYDAPG